MNGNTIRALRTLKGQTQEDIARKTGWPQTRISRIERGLHPPLSHLEEQTLAAALGVSPSTLSSNSFSVNSGLVIA